MYVAGIGAETGEVDGERYEEAVCVIKKCKGVSLERLCRGVGCVGV